MKTKGLHNNHCFRMITLCVAMVLFSCQSSHPKENNTLAKARIEYISKGRVTSHGYSGDKITVSYKPLENNQTVNAPATFKVGSLQKGDSVLIYYNPKNPEGMVYGAQP